MSTVTMTLENHDETIAEGVVLIDFWADWCGPCKRFAPVFEKVAAENPGAVFAKVDTEDQRELAAKYGITSIPTLVVYRDGIPVFGQPGALPEPALRDILTQVESLDMEDVRARYSEQVAAHQHD